METHNHGDSRDSVTNGHRETSSESPADGSTTTTTVTAGIVCIILALRSLQTMLPSVPELVEPPEWTVTENPLLQVTENPLLQVTENPLQHVQDRGHDGDPDPPPPLPGAHEDLAPPAPLSAAAARNGVVR